MFCVASVEVPIPLPLKGAGCHFRLGIPSSASSATKARAGLLGVLSRECNSSAWLCSRRSKEPGTVHSSRGRGGSDASGVRLKSPGRLARRKQGAAEPDSHDAPTAVDDDNWNDDCSDWFPVAGVPQTRPLGPKSLADPDSKFRTFRGIELHYKEATPSSTPRQHPTAVPNTPAAGLVKAPRSRGAVLLHGLGGSCVTWEAVTLPLAEALGGPVIAFDRPGFGLTERAKPPPIADFTQDPGIDPYSLQFFLDAAVEFAREAAAQTEEKPIIVGHSNGGQAAVQAVLEAPDAFSALVLVDAVIFPPLFPRRGQAEQKTGNTPRDWTPAVGDGSSCGSESEALGRGGSHPQSPRAFPTIVRGLRCHLTGLSASYSAMLLRNRAARSILRHTFDQFGVLIIKSAWADPSQCTEQVVLQYLKPLRCRNWDRGLLEFVIAAPLNPPIGSRLKEIKCPVLVVNGEKDRTMPSWLSKQVAEAIPGAAFAIVPNCGHVTQEEKPSELLGVITNFLSSHQ